jgi:hypothetical protein
MIPLGTKSVYKEIYLGWRSGSMLQHLPIKHEAPSSKQKKKILIIRMDTCLEESI